MTDAPPRRLSPGLKFLIEFGPLLLFFVAFMKFEIFVATGVFMVAIVVSLAISVIVERRWPRMLVISAILVLILGGLTIYMKDETFIKIKVTVVNVLFALTLLVGLAFRRLFLQYMLDSAFQLTPAGWRSLTYRWVGFFLTIAAVNEAVWRSSSTETWVKFKTFGVLPLTLVFTIAFVMPVLTKHGMPEEAPGEETEGVPAEEVSDAVEV